MEKQYEYTRIRNNIWQIAEDRGVYCTLVKGSDMAMLIDTGYGNRNLRAFVEEHITTPYMVVNSHGHPDHIGGNRWFDTIWAAREETLQKTVQLDFISYICGHSEQEYQKDKIQAHVKNIENLKVDECSKRELLGFETYCSTYQDVNGKSEIVFTEDKLSV